MNNKNVKVRCIKSVGRLFTFPITINKVYEGKLLYTNDIEEDGIVNIVNDLGEKDIYSIKGYFEVI